jgi:hypothetical protein
MEILNKSSDDAHGLGSTAVAENRLNAALSLAAVSLMNGSASQAQRDAALAAAQRAGVTALDYLRFRLLLQAAAVGGESQSQDILSETEAFYGS